MFARRAISLALFSGLLALGVGFAIQFGLTSKDSKSSIERAWTNVAILSPEGEKRALAYQSFLWGMLHEKRKDFEGASKHFEKAASLDSDSSILRLHWSISLEGIGQREAADEVIQQAKTQEPHNPKIRVLAGLIHAARHDYAKAIAEYQSVLEEFPEHELALSSTAELLVMTNHLEQSLEIFERLSVVRPDSASIFFNWAIVESRLGRFEDAEKHLEHALEINSRAHFMWSALALIYEYQEKFDEAIIALKKALDMNPTFYEYYHNLARIFYKTNRIQEAIQQYETVLRLKPSDANASMDAAYLHMHLKQYDQAINKLNAAIDLGNQDEQIFRLKATAHYYWGAQLDREQNDGESRYHLLRAIQLDPKNAEAYNYLGYMDIESGQNLDQAILWIQTAVELDPDNAAYIDSLGWAYYKKGLYDKALNTLEKAVSLDGVDEIIRNHLAELHDALGESRRALESQETRGSEIPELMPVGTAHSNATQQ